MTNQCTMCGHRLVGRTDKRFCSTKCRVAFNKKEKQELISITKWIDSVLHRNRQILHHLLGEKDFLQIHRLVLDKQKFNWHYFTHTTINNRGKTYYHLYDIRYMKFSDGGMNIYRNQAIRKIQNQKLQIDAS